MHPAGIDVEVEMKIDVEVELFGHGEDACDLAMGIGVGIGAPADQVGPGGAGRGQQVLGAGIVGEALLGKDADLQVDRPGIVRLEPADRFESLQPDAGIDLHMGAHMGGALDDRAVQGALRAGIDVVLGEGGLGSRHRRNRLLQGAALAAAAIGDAGLVEMDVGVDEAGKRQPSVERNGAGIGRDMRGDLGNAAAGDADVEQAVRAGDPGLAQHEVERHGAILLRYQSRKSFRGALLREPGIQAAVPKSSGFRVSPEPAIWPAKGRTRWAAPE